MYNRKCKCLQMEPDQTDDDDECPLCAHVNRTTPANKEDPTVQITEKGADGVNNVCEKRELELRVLAGQKIHVDCRRVFCKRVSMNKNQAEIIQTDQRPLRSKITAFNFKEHCLFCTRKVSFDGKKRGHDVFPVRTKDFDKSVLQTCRGRNDDWARDVQGRLEYAQDLHAADAVYHNSCSSNFRTGKGIPKEHTDEKRPGRPKQVTCGGRPETETRSEAFDKVVDYLIDNNLTQITLADLVQKMTEYLESSNVQPYSAVYMKAKLLERFGTEIHIAKCQGNYNVVTLKNTVSAILKAHYNGATHIDPESQKKRIIESAAKLIKDDIKSMKSSNDNYDTQLSLSESLAYLPDSLKTFMNILVSGKESIKIASLGQALVQAARPRNLLAPLQIGMGVQMHHHFASRFLIDSLHAHGFSCSYAEVQMFERSAAVTQNTDLPLQPDSDVFVQHSADNADHDIRTLDGHGTFHGMGIIAALTPGVTPAMIIPRVKVTAEDIAAVGSINIEYFRNEGTPQLHLQELHVPGRCDSIELVDDLWKLLLPIRPNRPAWQGYAQMVYNGDYPGKSSIFFLPMIDINASDPTCVLSTMRFVCMQAKKYGFHPVITFDQPLWWKGMTIIQQQQPSSDLKSIVLRLGGFHIQMSFLGSIGHLMAGTGIQELFEVMYADASVPHLLSGKAVSRAIRAHFLTDAALHAILMSRFFDLDIADNSDELCECGEDLKEVGSLFDNLQVEAICNSSELKKVIDKLVATKHSVLHQRTSALWVQYMSMIDILRKFIKAERTGQWDLHLQAVHEMLPYFAASGHNLYTKSAYLYLQTMLNLKERHPGVYKKFQEGFHVVRRSERYWAGLSTDLAIEQVLMRSLKTSGGLTHGRGMTETQRVVWVLSMPVCTEMNRAMQEYTGLTFSTGSDQHKEVAEARQERDKTDTYKLISYLKERNPFTGDDNLRSISTGVAASPSVNVDDAKTVGEKILKSMIGQDVFQLSFKRKDQAITLESDKGVKINGETFQVDPQLLFQRLIAVKDRLSSQEDVFTYELCSHPSSLFANSVLPREANKPELANAIFEKVSKDQSTQPSKPNGNVQYVVDGGALLHRIPWTRGKTYQEIIDGGCEYVKKHYGNAIIVFDSYDAQQPSTKDVTHLRRNGGVEGPAVSVSLNMISKLKKAAFLSNKANKQAFINLFSTHLQYGGCTVHHANSDADVLIVQKALEASMSSEVVVIADDTDILILLIYHADVEQHTIFLRSEPKPNAKTNRIWDIRHTKLVLGLAVCSCILFAHAILGCDTTSRVHGLGKGAALKKLCNTQSFVTQAVTFTQEGCDSTDIAKAGERALVNLYGGKDGVSLNELRYARFCQKVATSTKPVEVRTLPPTSAAAKHHSLRVYYQVQEWKATSSVLNPEEWGWQRKADILLPILTDMPAAQKELLEIIRCSCKSGCSTGKCSCRKHGLECTTLCGNCKGVGCDNSPTPDLVEDDNLDEDQEPVTLYNQEFTVDKVA